MSEPSGQVCFWCEKEFAPRRDGGKRQVFCRPACRRAFDAAGRRWVADAIAGGTLTVDALRNGVAATRALLPRVIWSALVPEPRKIGSVASAERSAENDTVELLDDFLIALLDLPGDIWPDLAAALPDEIFDRIDRYMEGRLS